ncbi:hypothetical protein [Bacillus pseudomycoides]|nr:hypothetical protein [Bacillus pseudomycoides]
MKMTRKKDMYMEDLQTLGSFFLGLGTMFAGLVIPPYEYVH